MFIIIYKIGVQHTKSPRVFNSYTCQGSGGPRGHVSPDASMLETSRSRSARLRPGNCLLLPPASLTASSQTAKHKNSSWFELVRPQSMSSSGFTVSDNSSTTPCAGAAVVMVNVSRDSSHASFPQTLSRNCFQVIEYANQRACATFAHRNTTTHERGACLEHK